VRSNTSYVMVGVGTFFDTVHATLLPGNRRRRAGSGCTDRRRCHDVDAQPTSPATQTQLTLLFLCSRFKLVFFLTLDTHVVRVIRWYDTIRDAILTCA